MDIRPVDVSDRVALKDYAVADKGRVFTKTPLEALEYSQGRTGYHPYACYEKDTPVAFFVLDEGPDKFDYTNEENTLLLRSFSVDHRHLRKGYGRAIVCRLPEIARKLRPGVHAIVLGVHVKNAAALALYSASGFVDTGRVFHGIKGAQVVMSMPVDE